MSGYNGRGLHGRTVSVLGARIVSGELPPGVVLAVNVLAAELDLSLAALREAMKVLAAKGQLDARQKRGTVVLPRERWNLFDADVIRWRCAAGETAAVLRDLAEVRAVVEPEATAPAARRRTDDDLLALDDALHAMRAAVGGDRARATAADLWFHRALLYATHNEMLARMDVFIEPALSLLGELVHRRPDVDPVPTHARVLEAVRAGDATEAAAAARALLVEPWGDVATTD